jgi:sulfatase maturation enzyme AslB (radical SAM superfamily)
MLSSTWLNEFKKTEIDLLPQDWQIDLGNFCNSACVFCEPESSSKLAAEYMKLGLISKLPKTSWCNDPKLLQKFIDTLRVSNEIKYIHFVGGETLITPEFKIILSALIENNLTNTTIGFTTNVTVWNQDVIDLLSRFKNVHIGTSVECFHSVNDYIRYGSDIETVKTLVDKWHTLAKQNSWSLSIRTTPTILSIGLLDTVYEYAFANNIAVESCNILDRPIFLRSSVLPMKYRKIVIDKLNNWLADKEYIASNQPINTRNSHFVKQHIIEDAKSYINYLTDAPDESHLMPQLIEYLHLIESNRKNSILTYLPEYEELLRTAGY